MKISSFLAFITIELLLSSMKAAGKKTLPISLKKIRPHRSLLFRL